MRDLLYLLPALACPVGMGVMMWLMMRPNRSKTVEPSPDAAGAANQVTPDPEVASLRKEIAGLRAELEGRSVPSRTPERTP
ncbi:hypothetical protein Stsp02_20480 [Streptomyces sp. NBRC 14336]|jgi:hypothetical protein|uniref:Phage shock protein B n=1 Tax=Streptomyces thermocarboxydovorans TaxID=59298 RepID=A0ABN1HEM4_9ACTN|nr:hypothetical protein [Streptomyces sp. NBRC 14336]GLW46386.1 hypothetical protein Stsp02_20480 [Streptomyces sp. NBRC 14336]